VARRKIKQSSGEINHQRHQPKTAAAWQHGENGGSIIKAKNAYHEKQQKMEGSGVATSVKNIENTAYRKQRAASAAAMAWHGIAAGGGMHKAKAP